MESPSQALTVSPIREEPPEKRAGHRQANALRWLRAEYSTKTEARQAIGVRNIIDDAAFYVFLKLLAAFVRIAGYVGLLVNIDELVVLSHRLANTAARNSNYEAILRIVNDCLQGFATPVEYAVIFKTRPIGRLPSLALPRDHDHLLLAARRWEVVSIDHDRCAILVVPARGRKAPRFLGGVGEIHPRTRQMMREVVLGKKDYSYLNETVAKLLQQAREAARACDLSTQALIALGQEGCLWFTWTGTIIQRTLCLMAELAGLESTDYDIAISS